MSIWDCDKPLDAMMLSHDHIAMLAVKHEKEIQELKRLVTPMMEFKRREWVGLTDEEATALWESTDDRDSWELLKRVEKTLKRKNT